MNKELYLMNNMKKELKELTWKYFWQQKFQEIRTVFNGLFAIWGMISVSVLILYIVKEYCELQIQIFWLYNGIIVTSIWVIIGFISWVKSNWKEASIRAKKDLRK